MHGKAIIYMHNCIMYLYFYAFTSLCRGICSNEKDDPVKDKLDVFFSPLSKAYMEICKKQTREFFGLRDFYRYYFSDFTL